MGKTGPVPKHPDQRRRANSPEPERAPGAAVVVVPEPDPKWHEVARQWFESLAESGQSARYEPSDWATAVFVAESMSRELKPQVVGVSEEGEIAYAVVPVKGAAMNAYLKAMTALLVTEGDRRRAGLQLERGAPAVDDPAVAILSDYRSA